MRKFTSIIKEIFDIKLLKFFLVGLLNTVLGLGLTFLFYNFTSLGYWGSSAISFVLASIFSYFANKHFTFSSTDKDMSSLFRFILVISLSYFSGFYLSKVAVLSIFNYFFNNVSKRIAEQMALLFGNALYSFFNYLGQRYFAFRSH